MSAAAARAVQDVFPDAVVADGELMHIDNPVAEQRALTLGSAFAVLTDRAVIAVSGGDRLSWLDAVTSQQLKDLPAGVSTELLVLDPQGRIEHAAGVVDDGETTWLIVDSGDAEALQSWLHRMRFRAQVTVRFADELVVLGGAPELIARVVANAGAPVVWTDPWPGITPGGVGYARPVAHPGAARLWAEAAVPAGVLPELLRGAEKVAGTVAADALRVAAWRPRWRIEVDEKALPHESDWLRTAVHLNKGCYRGQETVAKVHNLGHPPRRLAALQLDGSGSELPVPGAAVRVAGQVVGSITSAGFHFEDGPIALAYLRRNTPADAELIVEVGEGEIAAAQQVIVPASAGAAADIPKLPRLGTRTR